MLLTDCQSDAPRVTLVGGIALSDLANLLGGTNHLRRIHTGDPGLRFQVPESGFGLWALGLRVWDQGFGLRISGSEFRDQGSSIRV